MMRSYELYLLQCIIILNVLTHLIFQIFLWINQLKMFNRYLIESRVWLKSLCFDELCSRNHLLNKLDNHFIILYLGDSKICIGFHLTYLDDFIRRERERERERERDEEIAFSLLSIRQVVIVCRYKRLSLHYFCIFCHSCSGIAYKVSFLEICFPQAT